MTLLNKHLQKIILEYVEYNLDYTKELLHKTNYIWNDNLNWWVYGNYAVRNNDGVIHYRGYRCWSKYRIKYLKQCWYVD